MKFLWVSLPILHTWPKKFKAKQVGIIFNLKLIIIIVTHHNSITHGGLSTGLPYYVQYWLFPDLSKFQVLLNGWGQNIIFKEMKLLQGVGEKMRFSVQWSYLWDDFNAIWGECQVGIPCNSVGSVFEVDYYQEIKEMKLVGWHLIHWINY